MGGEGWRRGVEEVERTRGRRKGREGGGRGRGRGREEGEWTAEQRVLGRKKKIKSRGGKGEERASFLRRPVSQRERSHPHTTHTTHTMGKN